MVKLIKDNNATKVEDVLARLPKSYLTNWAMECNSSSAQQSDHNNPRIMMYGGDARTTISINGDAAHNGFNALEMTIVDYRTGIATLYSIQFDGKGGHKLVGPNPREDQATDAHATNCMGCHGSGTTIPVGDLAEDRRGPEKCYADFLRDNCNPNDPRDLVKSRPNLFRYQSLFCRHHQAKYGSIDAANRCLNQHLGALDSKRVARLIEGSPRYSQFRYAILGNLANCAYYADRIPAELLDVTDFLPTKENQKLGGSETLARNRQEQKAQLAEINEDQSDGYRKNYRSYLGFYDAQTDALGGLAYVLGDRMELGPRSDSAISIYPATMSPEFSVTAILPQLVEIDAKLAVLGVPVNDFIDAALDPKSLDPGARSRIATFCQMLKSISLTQFDMSLAPARSHVP